MRVPALSDRDRTRGTFLNSIDQRAAIKEGDSGKGESKEDIFFLY